MAGSTTALVVVVVAASMPYGDTVLRRIAF